MGSEEVVKKVKDVRFAGYKVNCENWRVYTLKGFKMHNCLVLILATCSQFVETFRQMILHIEDPFMRFTEFALRANIYRNIVISIEVLLLL